MTKREQKKLIRQQEKQAVAMYLTGRYTLKQIKRRTTVPGWVVRGLVIAHTCSRI